MHNPDFRTEDCEVSFKQERNHQHHSGFITELQEFSVKAGTHEGMNELLQPKTLVRFVEHD